MYNKFGLFFVCLLSLPLGACAIADKKNSLASPSIEVSQENLEGDMKNKSAKELVRQAQIAYSWFMLGTTMEVDDDAKKEVDGLVYYKVAYDRYDTREKMDKYLRAIFSDDIVKSLWSVDSCYIESDGFLYFLAYYNRNPDMRIEDEKYVLKEMSDNKAVYTVNVTYYPESGENPCEYEYVMEKVNDNWVFTTFPFYW